MEKYTEFSMRLKSARERCGLSKVEVARQAGVSAAYIGQLEAMTDNFQKNPSDLLIEKLAQIFGVNSVWLKSGEGEDKGDMLSANVPGLRSTVSPEDAELLEIIRRIPNLDTIVRGVNQFSEGEERESVNKELNRVLLEGLVKRHTKKGAGTP